jgi:hypothetical protein
MGQVVPEPVKDREAVRVDVPPVRDIETSQRLEHRNCIPAAEDHHGAHGDRERKVGDLVLDHVNPADVPWS